MYSILAYQTCGVVHHLCPLKLVQRFKISNPHLVHMLSMSMECDSQILIVPLTLNNEVVAQYLTFQFQLLSYTYLSYSVGSTSYFFHNIFFFIILPCFKPT